LPEGKGQAPAVGNFTSSPDVAVTRRPRLRDGRTFGLAAFLGLGRSRAQQRDEQAEKREQKKKEAAHRRIMPWSALTLD